MSTTGFSLIVDDSGVRQELERVVNPQVTAAAMARVKNILLQFVLGTYRDQTDPWGAPWPEWADSTKAARRAHRDYRVQKLVDSRDMLNSVKGDSDATGVSISMGDGLGDYPLAQQFGTNNAGSAHNVHIPARATFPMSSPTDVAFPDEWITQVYEPIQQAYEEELNK
jgi:hypothetical protein